MIPRSRKLGRYGGKIWCKIAFRDWLKPQGVCDLFFGTPLWNPFWEIQLWPFLDRQPTLEPATKRIAEGSFCEIRIFSRQEILDQQR